MQVCSICGIKKPLDMFYKNRNQPRKNCKTCHEKSKMKSKVGAYGLSLEQYYGLIEKQNGSCAICLKSFDNTKHRHIDHCHETNKVRGILCHGCNTAIGLLKESETVLLSALKYLKNS